jgi:hypothetical protein
LVHISIIGGEAERLLGWIADSFLNAG